MDGNNRWSKKNKLSLFNGYNYGADRLFKLTEYIFDTYDVNHISAFALSKNNLNRKKSIVSALNKTLSYFIKQFSSKNTVNFSISFKGDLKFLDKKQQASLKYIESLNKDSKHKLHIFLNYSGRIDILNAAKIISLKKYHTLNFEDLLMTKKIPNPDLLIRTGGFSRISDFMLYQLAFTELFFVKKLWPDLSRNDIKKIIDSYLKIERKFGF